MRNVVFAAPFPAETTMRFARAAARLDGVRLLGIAQTPPTGDDAKMFADLAKVKDGLDTAQLLMAARRLEQRHGKIHRVLRILEPLPDQPAKPKIRIYNPVTGGEIFVRRRPCVTRARTATGSTIWPLVDISTTLMSDPGVFAR